MPSTRIDASIGILEVFCRTFDVLACDSSQAANRRMQNNTVPSNAAPARGGNVVNNGYARPAGPFGRLMEMERNKNAALRQMFFGR